MVTTEVATLPSAFMGTAPLAAAETIFVFGPVKITLDGRSAVFVIPFAVTVPLKVPLPFVL